MNTTDRRAWLKTMALGGGLTLFGGATAFAELAKPDRIPAAGPVKLNANENPYGPSEAVRKTIIANMDTACRYPFAYSDALVRAIAAKEEVDESCVVITGGSTEGLKAAGLVYGLEGGEIIAADPTFQSLLTYGEYFGAYVHRVPLDEHLGHDLEAMHRRVTSKTRLIFICNPNNPSGTLLDAEVLRDFIRSTEKQAVIFSDEAYYDFITEPDYPSMVEFVKAGHNVIVSKTFSKVYGLAGMRVGYLIARPDIAARLRDSLMANTNTLALIAAEAALKDDAFYQFSLQQNQSAKAHIYEAFDNMGVQYVRSHTNFVFFKSGMEVRPLIGKMAEKGVQIGRPFPPLTDWARISTGTLEDVRAFTGALKQVLS